jgi:hypothetical protein
MSAPSPEALFFTPPVVRQMTHRTAMPYASLRRQLAGCVSRYSMHRLPPYVVMRFDGRFGARRR